MHHPEDHLGDTHQSRTGDPAAEILNGYLDEATAARALGRQRRTLQRWRANRTGPPVTFIGKSPYYRKESLRQWLREQERSPVRRKKARA